MDEIRKATGRRYDVDWLRVLAVLLLIPYHTAVIFDPTHVSYIKVYHVPAMEALAYFLRQWHMPLFFLISGAATWFSLGSRSGSYYIGERIKRLAIPLIFGTLTIIPIMIYFQRLYYREFSGSYLRFYPHFFDGLYPRGNFSWGNLWFLAYLFVFSLVALPLFLFLRGDRGRRVVSTLGVFCERRGAIFLLAIPLAVTEVALRARWPGLQNLYRDWANFFSYLTFFIYGYLLFSDERFGRAIDRHGKISLFLGICSICAIFGLRWTGLAPERGYTIGWTLYMILHAFNSWFWIVAVLSFAGKCLNFCNKALRYGNEAALPFYILHHAAIVAVAYYVMKWNFSVAGKFLAICTVSLVATLVLYDLVVRRAGFTRFLFGMKPGRTVARVIVGQPSESAGS